MPGRSDKLQILLEVLKDDDELKDVVRDIQGLGRTGKRTAGDMARHTKRIDRGFKDVRGSVVNVKRAIAGLAAAAGLAAIGYQIQKLAKEAISVAAGFEQMQIQLDTITKGEGETWFRKLNEWALKMPVNTERAIRTFTMLRAMGLKPTIQDMTTLVDTTSALGGGADTLEGIGRALGQIATKGKVSAEELMQLAERGVPAYEILQEKLGLSAQQVANIGNEAIDGRRTVGALIEGMAERFGGQSRRMMDTWNGLMEALRSYWKEFLRAVMDSGPFQIMRERLKELVDFIDEARQDGRLEQWVNEAAEGILNAFKAGIEAGKIFFNVILAGFKALTMAVRGWRMIFGLVKDEVNKLSRKGLESERKLLEQRLKAVEMSPLMGSAERQKRKAEIEERLRLIDEETERLHEQKDDGKRYVHELIAEQDRYNRSIESTKEKIDSLAGFFRKKVDEAVAGGEGGAPEAAYVDDRAAAAQVTENLKGELKKRLAAYKKTANDQLETVRQKLTQEEGLYQQLADKVKGIRDGMRRDQERTEGMLRGLARESMSEVQQWYDRRKEAEEKAAEARRAYLAGDVERAKELAREAQDLAQTLATEVTDEEGKTVIERAFGTAQAKKIIQEAGDLMTAAWNRQKDAAEDALQAQADKVEPLKQKWQELKGLIEEYDKKLASLSEKPVSLEVEVSNLREIESRLDEITRDRTVTMTILEKRVQAARLGGLIQALAGGGKLAGYGGGDRIRALLEPGEFVMRKEAVRRYGAGLFELLNNLKFSLPRIPAPQIPRAQPAFAAGGLVGGGAMPYLGRMDLYLEGKKVEVLVPRDSARDLEKLLKRRAKTR
jgi:tape measure domain-containing protein